MKPFLMHAKWLLLAALIPALASCKIEGSDSVVQDKIWTRYVLEYNADDDATYARAQFRFSNPTGTLLQLTAPAEVTFNGDAMTFNAVLGYYEKKYAGMVASGTFRYEDLDGGVFENALTVADAIAFPASLDSISQAAAFDLAWTGNAIGGDDLVTVSIDGENQGDLQIFLTDTPNAASIVLNKDKLQRLGTGPAKIFMNREYRPEIGQAPGAGGELIGRHVAEFKDIVIVP
ncbi:MAG: hypothetical protein NW241_06200 [Bacteroidia bacterium]|nr:hypothetical protein [Bacteroidia bacterium]